MICAASVSVTIICSCFCYEHFRPWYLRPRDDAVLTHWRHSDVTGSAETWREKSLQRSHPELKYNNIFPLQAEYGYQVILYLL